MRMAAKLMIYYGALAMVMAGCSDIASAVRQVTYPPDFTYVSGAELRSQMDWLAYQMTLLDEALEVDEPGTVDQQKVVSTLREIELLSAELRAGNVGASHGFLADDMPHFVNTVSRARMAAALSPPRYYLAGRISGACLNCHKRNR